MPEEVEIPDNLNTPAFLEAWGEFLAHRIDIRKKLTPRAQRMQLKKLAAWGPDRAVAAIEHSVGNGYVGIFEPPVSKGREACPQASAKKPFSLWEIKEREKALQSELESINSNYYGQDAERVNAERAQKRKRIRAKLRELRELKLGLDDA